MWIRSKCKPCTTNNYSHQSQWFLQWSLPKLSVSRRQCSIQSCDLAPAGISSQLEPTTSCSKGLKQTIWAQGKEVKINIQKSSAFLDNCHPSAGARGSWARDGTAHIWNAPARELHENPHTSWVSALWWVCLFCFFLSFVLPHAAFFPQKVNHLDIELMS